MEKATPPILSLSIRRMVPGGSFIKAASTMRMREGFVSQRWLMKFSGTVLAFISSTFSGTLF